MKIEIFGPGCYRCKATEENVRKALQAVGLEAEVVHVSDYREFARRGIMVTPAVAIEGKTMSSGRIPDVEQVRHWLQDLRAA